MESMYYIGLNIHKKLISYCVKDARGRIQARPDCCHALRPGRVDENTSRASPNLSHWKYMVAIPERRFYESAALRLSYLGPCSRFELEVRV